MARQKQGKGQLTAERSPLRPSVGAQIMKKRDKKSSVSDRLSSSLSHDNDLEEGFTLEESSLCLYITLIAPGRQRQLRRGSMPEPINRCDVKCEGVTSARESTDSIHSRSLPSPLNGPQEAPLWLQ
ncbi:hypothetical protein Q7C36_011250 [Tachysurus vachellii]|uniref:Uncharacterized protein n=1 Tax=Tachysurus vachellii TaxID=175792 RepID=A0AA88MQF5_TACVA|nr:hypothetical protein Q7C36_011250 [Tachysurus vachellii]